MINYDYLRPQKGAQLKSIHDSLKWKQEPLSVQTYPNATILPLRRVEGDHVLFGCGGAVDENGAYIRASALENFVQNGYKFDQSVKSDKKVVFCGYLIDQWGHFLLQAVARLWYFLENDATIDRYVFFVKEGEERELKGNYRMFFELLGILDKLEIINEPTLYRELVIPELSYDWIKYVTPQFAAIFDRVAENVKPNPDWKTYDKIFLTRSQFKKARETEIGTEVFDDYFRKNGYEILSPEKIPLPQLIYLIRNASDCAFVSGTAPHNMVFARDGQHCTILERGASNNDFQANVNVARDLNVTYIDANISIYIVNAGMGPFILSYKGMLEKYTNDNQLSPPNHRYTSESYLRKQFAAYMEKYRRQYAYQVYMEDWLLSCISHRYEAYADAQKYVGEYLNGSKPFKVSQCIRPRYLYSALRRILHH